MVKRLLALVFSVALVFSISMPVSAQEAKPKADKDKAPKADRWEGNVTLVSKAKSTLTVRKIGTHDEKVIAYDATTQWVSQEHGAKTVNKIDANQVTDGDRVICVGTIGKDGIFHATTISKRLTPP